MSGATLTVTDFVETSGSSGRAWDLSVAGVHNFFVAADASAEPVLVHNASNFCPLPISLSQFQTLANITDPVKAAAYADVLTTFGRLTDDAATYEGTVRSLVDFAGSNPDDARRLVVSNPLWVRVAAIRGEGPLRGLLDVAGTTPAVLEMSADGAIAAARTLGDLASPPQLLNVDQQLLLGVFRSATTADEALLIAKNADADLAITRNALSSGSERLVLTNPNHVSAVANSAQGVHNVIDALRRGSRSDAADSVSEAIALQELEDLQAAALAGGFPDPHGLSRHGAQTTLEQQYLRATTGVLPDRPNIGTRPIPASRSTSHVTHVQMLREARQQIAGVGQETVWIRFSDNRIVGEGFEARGKDYFEASWVRVNFQDGPWVTNSFFSASTIPTSGDLVSLIP